MGKLNKLKKGLKIGAEVAKPFVPGVVGLAIDVASDRLDPKCGCGDYKSEHAKGKRCKVRGCPCYGFSPIDE